MINSNQKFYLQMMRAMFIEHLLQLTPNNDEFDENFTTKLAEFDSYIEKIKTI